jgi:hypothetical protein
MHNREIHTIKGRQPLAEQLEASSRAVYNAAPRHQGRMATNLRRGSGKQIART